MKNSVVLNLIWDSWNEVSDDSYSNFMFNFFNVLVSGKDPFPLSHVNWQVFSRACETKYDILF